MKGLISFIVLLFITVHALAGDTTSVNVYFDLNDYKLSNTAKAILNDVQPDDSTITLKRIFIYGYSDKTEKDNGNSLSEKRAQEVKKYLLSKNISAALMVDTKGKGNANQVFIQETGNGTQQNQKVWVIIEYDAKVVEQTIIIKSNKKTQDNE
jgi:outer membrane protein OmpA-like peptidoglycan-associated protein